MGTQSRKFTILLVDDREENLVSLEHILEDENRVLLKARSGHDALKMVMSGEQIGLIMLDVQMPGMDGFEVAGLLQSNERTKNISIIFVTAISKEDQYILKGFEHGAVDYLQKPLDVNVTRAKVKVFEQLYFYQQDLKSTIEQKEKINKQLERFMFVVAHDLKSPLSGVVSLLNIMKEDDRIATSEQLKEYMVLMIDASTHLTGMIGSILEYSRKNDSDASVEIVDVHELVMQISHLLFPPRHIHIRIEGTLPTIHTQKLKLQQVFQNLLTNAIKYNDKEQGEISVGFEDDGDFYRFYVQDNGQGIAERDREFIFKLFAVGDGVSQRDSSTGVGLNILKVLVEEQGGKTSVDSQQGKGSTFYFQWRK